MISSLLLLATSLTMGSTGHTVVNTGRTVASGKNVLFQVDHRTVFIESQTQSVEIYDARDGSLENLGLPVPFRVPHLLTTKDYELRVVGRFAVFSVKESAAGVDLNGNGWPFDEVLHIHDLEQGVTVNTQLAMPSAPLTFAFSFWAERALQQGPWLTFIVRESSAGDLNGDGDTLDRASFVYDGNRSQLIGLGVATFGGVIDGDDLLYSVDEFGQGGLDLNGDGDGLDGVLHRLHLPTGAKTNLQQELSFFNHVPPNGLLRVYESSVGADLTGDGVIDDYVFAPLDDAGQSRLLGISGDIDDFIQAVPGMSALGIREAGIGPGVDVTGDGDLFDQFLYVWHAAEQRLERTGVQIAGVLGLQAGPERSIVTYATSELVLGIDVSGNGVLGGDYVWGRWASGLGSQFAPWVGWPEAWTLDGTRLAIEVDESAEGLDINGDGAVAGDVLVGYDFETESSRVVPWPVVDVEVNGGWLYAQRSEFLEGIDWNGDGVVFGGSVFAIDIATGTEMDLGYGSSLFPIFGPRRTRGHLPIQIFESDTDLNGDGDLFDSVLHVAVAPDRRR